MEQAISTKSGRFLSLDVFRGMTVCLMIIVNSPGTGAKIYSYLAHADWFGFTLADLVFPSFLFAVGNAMSFSLAKKSLADESGFWKKVIKRTLLIFLIGYLMYWYPFFRLGAENQWELIPVGETRIMGVLQRIALCYFFAAVIVRYCSEKVMFIISAALLLSYWGILYWLGEPGKELEMASNAVTKIDLLILGEGHIYKRDAIPFDPEGILSTIPAVVNVVAGYLAGRFARLKGKSFEGIALLLIAGFALISLALWWDLIFPISKKLWTGPFVLYTTGLDLSVLAVLMYFIEIRKINTGVKFFGVFGKNPLFIYLFSELFYISLRLIPAGPGLDAFSWISENLFQLIFPGAFGALVTAVVFMMICWSIGWFLNKKRIFIKI